MKTKNYLLIWLFITVVYSLFCISYRNTLEYEVILFIGVSSIVLLLFQIRSIAKIQGSILSLCIIYLALFYLFQNGQMLLYLLNVEFGSFYMEKASSTMTTGVIYASVSNVVAGFSCLCVVSNKRSQGRQELIDRMNPLAVKKAATIGFWLTGMVAIPLVLLKTIVALRGGYASVRVYEESIPSVLNFFEYMFVPFSFLMLVYDRRGGRLYTIIILAWFMLTAYCGDRTVGLSGILLLFYIRSLNNGDGKKIKKKTYVGFAILIAVLVFAVSWISSARNKQEFNVQGGAGGVLVSTVSEMGFSSYPLLIMMDIVPRNEPYQYGVGYLSSFISGLLPANIDPTGIISGIMKRRQVYNQWIGDYYNYGFGLGFSLNAESYINFGWFGFIAIFLIHLVIFSWLNKIVRNKSSLFAMYSSCVLLFLWCTLPRRDSYYVWKALMYAIIVIKIYLMIFVNNYQKKKDETYLHTV